MAAKPTETATETKTESKAEKFVRLGASRTNKALDAIAAIGGLAAKNNYDYTDEQTAKIFAALEAEIAKVKDKFAGKTETVAGFTL